MKGLIMKFKGLTLLVLISIIFISLIGCSTGPRQDGSAEYPYLLNDGRDLESIGHGRFDMNSHYRITNHIHLSDNWTPVGSEDNPFNGVIEGNGYSIRGDVHSNESYVGLFAYIGKNGIIRDIKFDGNVFADKGEYIGAIAGINEGLIEKITFHGVINSSADFVGSIAGYNKGDIIDVSHQGDVYGNNYLGGIVGKNDGLLSIGFHQGNVGTDIDGNTVVGGVAAINTGIIEKISAGGEAYSNYSLESLNDGEFGGIGGLVGFNDGGTISESFSIKTVYGIDNVGGLIGYSINGLLINSYRLETLDLKNNYSNNVGLAIGYADGTVIENVYVTGHINHIDNANNIGNFIGNANNIIVENAYIIAKSGMLTNTFGTSDTNYLIGEITNEAASNPDEYEGFDFYKTWAMEKYSGDWQTHWPYPKLISQESKWLTHSNWRGSWVQ
ncbi:hypothetical protein [Natronospora cellulosivora (SeqCode)]